MRTKFNIQYHFLTILAAAVVVGLRFGDIRGYTAWQQGTATTNGEIDEISATRQVRVIRYSFAVDGKGYTDEIYSRTGFVEGGAATVTYAVSDPSVSTLQPERMAAIFRNSILLVVIVVLPMLIMWIGEIVHAFRRKRGTDAGASTLP